MKMRCLQMIINEVKLKNFGIYQGQHVFDFGVEPSGQNIVLINAKNGSGKTTLLTSIKVALYGPLLMGFRHVNPQYNAFIMDKINIDTLKKAEPEASIRLNFSMGGHGTSDHYILERSWTYNHTDLVESLQINKNSVDLSAKEVLEFENYTRKFFPPSLFDFFLFDGEQVHYQLEEGVLLNNIRDAFYSLFNLDLTALLQQDLQSYLKQDSFFKNLNKEQQRYNSLTDRHSLLKTQSNDEEDQILKLGQRIEDLQNETKKLELEFKLNDGLAAQERDQARQKLVNFERKKQEESEFLKTYIAELLPFYIAKDLIFAAKEQVVLESKQKAIDIFRNSVWDELHEHYSKYVQQNNHTDSGSELWDSLTEALKQMNQPLPFYHDLNESEKTQLMLLSEELQNLDADLLAKTQSNVSKYNNKIYKLRKKIEVNDHNEELNALLQKINRNNQSILEALQSKAGLELQHDATTETLIKVSTELVNVEKSLQQSQIDDNIFSIVIRIEKILSQFQSEVARNKTEALKFHFLDCFMNLNHKGNFVHHADFIFENNNFKIQLYDQNHTTINYNHLSAGEKQLFLLSLTWALLKTSQREVPLFFDTLLGRLDNDHRENIINRFLPYASKQVVVLSTDTEINDYYYELLKPYIAMEYEISAGGEREPVISIKKSPGGQKKYAI